MSFTAGSVVKALIYPISSPGSVIADGIYNAYVVVFVAGIAFWFNTLTTCIFYGDNCQQERSLFMSCKLYFTCISVTVKYV